jgi:hypothetical protein
MLAISTETTPVAISVGVSTRHCLSIEGLQVLQKGKCTGLVRQTWQYRVLASVMLPIKGAKAGRETGYKARTAYQDFLALCKDADPEIPILKEAKAEYEK